MVFRAQVEIVEGNTLIKPQMLACVSNNQCATPRLSWHVVEQRWTEKALEEPYQERAAIAKDKIVATNLTLSPMNCRRSIPIGYKMSNM